MSVIETSLILLSVGGFLGQYSSPIVTFVPQRSRVLREGASLAALIINNNGGWSGSYCKPPYLLDQRGGRKRVSSLSDTTGFPSRQADYPSCKNQGGINTLLRDIHIAGIYSPKGPECIQAILKLRWLSAIYRSCWEGLRVFYHLRWLAANRRSDDNNHAGFEHGKRVVVISQSRFDY